MAMNSIPTASHPTVGVKQDPSPLGTLQKLPTEMRLNIYEAVFEAYDGLSDPRSRLKERKTFVHPLLSASRAIHSEAVKSYKKRLDKLEAQAKNERQHVKGENMGVPAYIPGVNGLVSILRLPSLNLKAWDLALRMKRLCELREAELARMRSMGYLSD